MSEKTPEARRSAALEKALAGEVRNVASMARSVQARVARHADYADVGDELRMALNHLNIAHRYLTGVDA